MTKYAGILALGHALPDRERNNSDPIFDNAKHGAELNGVSEAQLFTGVRSRRVIDDNHSAEDLTVTAAQQALRNAGLESEQIDRLYGFVSPSRSLVPNGLYEVHHRLGLSRGAFVVPINSEFTNFLLACALAQEAVNAGACQYVLVACGGCWTRNMDYEHPHAWSVGDGASAVIIGPSDHLVWIGHSISTYGEAFRSMTLQVPTAGSPKYSIATEGVGVFLSLGMEEPPRLMLELMTRHNVANDELTLVTHQASARLMDKWAETIMPAAYLSTLADLGNMTLATAGVTLARQREKIATKYVGCMALGAGQHFMVALLKA